NSCVRFVKQRFNEVSGNHLQHDKYSQSQQWTRPSREESKRQNDGNSCSNESTDVRNESENSRKNAPQQCVWDANEVQYDSNHGPEREIHQGLNPEVAHDAIRSFAKGLPGYVYSI